MNHWTKLALEAGPLVIFFAANAATDLITATAVFVVATLVSVALSWILARRVPVMPLVGGVFVTLFGGLTVLLEDDLFIKIKPTIVNLLFSAILFVGLATGRLFIKLLLEGAMALTEDGWRKLTVRWGLFFLVLAALNEAVWRSVSSDMWVAFKVWGLLPLTVVFSLLQVPLIQRHQIKDPPPAES